MSENKKSSNSHSQSHSRSDFGPDYGTGKKNLPSYIIGILLSLLLTLIPYEAVARHSLNKTYIYAILIVCALIQLVVQVICFLRLNNHTEQGQINILSFLFSIVVLIVVVAASIWIMWHLNYNMMH